MTKLEKIKLENSKISQFKKPKLKKMYRMSPRHKKDNNTKENF